MEGSFGKAWKDLVACLANSENRHLLIQIKKDRCWHHRIYAKTMTCVRQQIWPLDPNIPREFSNFEIADFSPIFVTKQSFSMELANFPYSPEVIHLKNETGCFESWRCKSQEQALFKKGMQVLTFSLEDWIFGWRSDMSHKALYSITNFEDKEVILQCHWSQWVGCRISH